MTITVTDLRHATNPLTPNKDSLTFLKLFIQLSINNTLLSLSAPQDMYGEYA